MEFPFAKRPPRTLLLAAVVFALLALVLLVLEWPAPAALRVRILEEASGRMERRVTAEEVRVSPLYGVTLKNVQVGDTWPMMRAPWARGEWFGVIEVRGVEILAGRDAEGRLHFPWPEEVIAKRVRVTDGILSFWDTPLAKGVVFRRIAGEIRPASGEGNLTAQWGETEGFPIALGWAPSSGRLAIGRMATDWERSDDTEGIRLALRPSEEGRAGLAGSLRSTRRGWEARLRGAEFPGEMMDPILAGARIRGDLDLSVEWNSSRRFGRIALRGRAGKIFGVRAFRHLAARTGLARLAEPAFSRLDLEASLQPGRMEVTRSSFEGEGLGLRFLGTLTDRSVSGRLVALFTPDLAARIPELRDNVDLLDREGNRIRVDFVVSGSRNAPDLAAIPPPTSTLVIRRGGTFLRRGFSILSAPFRGFGRIFSSDPDNQVRR